MSKIQVHVEKLFRDIPESERKLQLKQEIVQNLEEKVNDLMEQGKSEEDAVNKAIVEFGDIEDIKLELGVGPVSHKYKTGLGLGFSVWGSILCIGLFIFMNFAYTPKTIWFIYPTFVIIWWPMVMYFLWRNRKKEGRK